MKTQTTRTHRMPEELYEKVMAEAKKSGNAVNNEINSLVLDGLRFRNAKIVIHLEEQQHHVTPHTVQ